MKQQKKILAGIMVVCLCAGLTGCGKEEVSVTSGLKVEYSGMNGYGTASLDESYDWIDDAIDLCEGLDEDEQFELELALYDAVSYEISPVENLSNGDEVTITISIDSDEFEDYDFELVGEEVTETVSGLEEVEEVDPFAKLNVTFEGIAPYATASIDSAGRVDGIEYTLDMSENLSNGDVVTVTAAPEYSMTEDELAQQYGIVLTQTEQSYTVEGLSAYVTSLDQIPEDMLTKLLSQAEDSIRADCAGWAEGNSLGQLDFLGYYFLTPKEGFLEQPYNEIYCIYQVTANMTGITADDLEHQSTGTETYYTYYHFTDILLLADGTTSVDLSAGNMPDNRIDSTFGYDAFWGAEAYTFDGYVDLDTMFHDCVSTKIANYNYESIVQE